MIIGSALLGYQLEDDFLLLEVPEIATISGNRKTSVYENDGLSN